jgi:hypothetical protein
VLGVLIVIFRRHRIAGTSRVARQLDVFLRDMGCGATNLDIGSVGLENPGHRVLATPVIVVVVIVIVIPVTHPLVVVILTVSHVSPFYRSKSAVVIVAASDAGRTARSRIAMQFNSASILQYVAFNKRRVPQPPAYAAGWTNHSAWQNKPRFSRVSFQAQYQAFVRFAVASSAALSAIALNKTCLLEPFTREGSRWPALAMRTLASTRSSYGANNP